MEGTLGHSFQRDPISEELTRNQCFENQNVWEIHFSIQFIRHFSPCAMWISMEKHRHVHSEIHGNREKMLLPKLRTWNRSDENINR